MKFPFPTLPFQILLVMKMVHSFWSKPIFSTLSEKNLSIAGWRHIKYHHMSWALSCLLLKKIYPKVELVTDIKGKELLIDQLELPYDDVKVELDCLNNYPSNLWAIGKVYAYSIQKEPFIHLDGDVFIWEPFDSRIQNADLLGQHVDNEDGHYRYGIKLLEEHSIELPEIVQRDISKKKHFRATNVGIIGGNNHQFFKAFANASFAYINKYLDKTRPSLSGVYYALIYEQLLYSAMARSKGIKIEHYLEQDALSTINLDQFLRKYGDGKYVHLFAQAKKRFEHCRELEMQLLLEFPEYHERVMRLVNNAA